MTPGGSAFNRSPEVLTGLATDHPVYLVDSTIRSLQSGVSGSAHTLDDLEAIGVALADLGVHELIINVSWRDGAEVVERLARRSLPTRLVATFRARNDRWESWARSAADAGADEISLESVRDPDHLRSAGEVVKSLGVDVSHGFAEAYELDEVIAITRAGVDVGCKSQSYHDSFFNLGIHPDAIRWFIRRILDEVPAAPPLYVHLSNFYGQATMTGVAAITAGATAVDVCMNDTGHHAGHTSLSETAVVLEHLYGISTGIRLERLQETARLLEKHTKVPVPIMKPVIGPDAFLGDGEYWAAEAHLPFEERMHATFPFSPDVVGGEEHVVWNDRTVTAPTVRQKLDSLGLDSTDERCTIAISALRAALDAADSYPSWLTEDAFERLLRGIAPATASDGSGR